MSDADAMSDAGAVAVAVAGIQRLQCPETLDQLCDGKDKDPVYYRGVGYKYSDIAFEAATEGQNISSELWAAGMWAVTRSYGMSTTVHRRVLTIIKSKICSDFKLWYMSHAAHELLTLAYMICPKGSKVFPLILYSLSTSLPWPKPVLLKESPADDITTTSCDELLSAVVSNPTATARLRARALCAQAWAHASPAASELICRAYAIDPTYIEVYLYWFTDGPIKYLDRSIQLGGRMLNKWGIALKCIETTDGNIAEIYVWIRDVIPYLDGTTISLGDSSMSIFDYICALETPHGSFFSFAMFTDMLPADIPWSCRRHAALDRRTGANALFATFLCALARLEGPGGPLRPSHQTMWEHALESWTLGDSASLY